MNESTNPYAPLPPEVHDAGRLAALEALEVLDTPAEPAFDEIVRLATLACEAPIALVSLVAGDRQWFKARLGFPRCQTDLNRSVCAHALAEPDLLVIPDLAADPRTRANPLVTGTPGIRFYAGAPLRDADGHALGTLCVIDEVPRPGGLAPAQAEMLRGLARQAMQLLQLRRAVSERDAALDRRRRREQRLDESRARLRISVAHWRGLFERLTEGLIIGELVRDAEGRADDWRYVEVNPAWGVLLGADPAAAIGRTVREVLPGIEEAWVRDFVRVAETGEASTFTREVGSLDRWYEGRAFPLGHDRFAVLFLEVTQRVRADRRREALLQIGDQLRDLDEPEAMTARVSAILGRALGAGRVGLGQLDRAGEWVEVGPDWTAPGMSSIAGRHRFEDYGDIRRELLRGEPLVVDDARDDPRTAGDAGRWAQARIRALVNIPVQEGGRTVAVLLVHDEAPRHWDDATVAFLRNAADRLMAGIARRRAEADQRLLNQELSHRMKNLLAMVQAIAAQTLRGVADQAAVGGFRDRLLALSHAHDVLLDQSWAASSLREVVEAVLGRIAGRGRVDVAGPAVTLGPRATLSLSLLLHELATNAAKYGALSAEAGRVAVSWRVDEAAGELLFRWHESGGPPVAAPARRGFGSRLIQAGLVGAGGVRLRFLAAGLRAEMRAGLEQLRAV